MLKIERKKLDTFLRRLNSHKFAYSGKMIQSSLDNALRMNNEGEDAYFYVNPGGTKEHEIKSTHCCFVDLDAGRDSNHKYFSMSKVILKKDKMLELIEKCPVKPHYIVETRNGYQVYWCTSSNDMTSFSKKKTWNATQYYIKQYFKQFADPRVGKVNQIMRVPYTTWYKKDERKDPFLVTFKQTPTNFRAYTLSKLYYSFKAEAKTVFTPAKNYITKGMNKIINNLDNLDNIDNTPDNPVRYSPIKPSYIYPNNSQKVYSKPITSRNNKSSVNIIAPLIPILKTLLNMGMEMLGQYEQKQKTR